MRITIEELGWDKETDKYYYTLLLHIPSSTSMNEVKAKVEEFFETEHITCDKEKIYYTRRDLSWRLYFTTDKPWAKIV